MYILFAKKIETFSSRDVTNIWLLPHFEFKIHKRSFNLSSLYVLNCFKYLGTKCLKIRQEKFLKELNQVFMY